MSRALNPILQSVLAILWMAGLGIVPGMAQSGQQAGDFPSFPVTGDAVSWPENQAGFFEQNFVDDPSSQPSVFANQHCFEQETWLTFLGIEGSKQPQDLGVNAHFGGRIALNHGRLLPRLQQWSEGRLGAIGIQLGTSLNATTHAVQVIERIEGSTSRVQSFSTVGLFGRSDSGITWAAGYDFLYQDYFDSALLGQWRMEIWRPLTDWDDVGFT